MKTISSEPVENATPMEHADPHGGEGPQQRGSPGALDQAVEPFDPAAIARMATTAARPRSWA